MVHIKSPSSLSLGNFTSPSVLSLGHLRGASVISLLGGRSSPEKPREPPINLADYTNPSRPPNGEIDRFDWTWVPEMQVWVPREYASRFKTRQLVRDLEDVVTWGGQRKRKSVLRRLFTRKPREQKAKLRLREDWVPWDPDMQREVLVQRQGYLVRSHGLAEPDLITLQEARGRGRAIFPPAFRGMPRHRVRFG